MQSTIGVQKGNLDRYDPEEGDYHPTDKLYEHPMLKVPILPIEEENEDYYWTIEHGYAWLHGFRPDEYWGNTTECFDRMTNFTYIQYPELDQYLNNDTSLETVDKINQTMYTVQNLSNHLWYCNSAWN